MTNPAGGWTPAPTRSAPSADSPSMTRRVAPVPPARRPFPPPTLLHSSRHGRSGPLPPFSPRARCCGPDAFDARLLLVSMHCLLALQNMCHHGGNAAEVDAAQAWRGGHSDERELLFCTRTTNHHYTQVTWSFALTFLHRCAQAGGAYQDLFLDDFAFRLGMLQHRYPWLHLRRPGPPLALRGATCKHLWT